jgi:hypothetical protein
VRAIFTAIRTLAPTMVGTTFTERALGLGISTLTIGRDGTTATIMAAVIIQAKVGVVAAIAVAEVTAVMAVVDMEEAVEVMGVAVTLKRLR